MAKMMTRDRDQGTANNTTAMQARGSRPRSLFEALFRSGFPDMPMNRDIMNALTALPDVTTFIPSVELSEKDGNYVIDMALPGFSQNDIDIEVSGNEITVTGRYERKKDDGKTHYSEMQQASFQRTIVLPQDINADKVEASFRDGMLHIVAPPTAPITAKKVAIKGET